MPRSGRRREFGIEESPEPGQVALPPHESGRALRNDRWRHGCAALEAIADAVHCEHMKRRGGIDLDLGAQPLHRRVERPGHDAGPVASDLPQEQLARQLDLRVLREIGQKRRLLGGQADLIVGPRDDARFQIDRAAGETDRRLSFRTLKRESATDSPTPPPFCRHLFAPSGRDLFRWAKTHKARVAPADHAAIVVIRV